MFAQQIEKCVLETKSTSHKDFLLPMSVGPKLSNILQSTSVSESSTFGSQGKRLSNNKRARVGSAAPTQMRRFVINPSADLSARPNAAISVARNRPPSGYTFAYYVRKIRQNHQARPLLLFCCWNREETASVCGRARSLECFFANRSVRRREQQSPFTRFKVKSVYSYIVLSVRSLHLWVKCLDGACCRAALVNERRRHWSTGGKTSELYWPPQKPDQFAASAVALLGKSPGR